MLTGLPNLAIGAIPGPHQPTGLVSHQFDCSTRFQVAWLALVDSLEIGTPDETQRDPVRALRSGILALVEQAAEVV